MRKRIAFILTILLFLNLNGCTNNTKDLSVVHVFYSPYSTQTIDLNTTQKHYIVNVLDEAAWIDDVSNCSRDYVFYIGEREISYHSDCGTFNDIKNSKSTTVSEEIRVAINAMLGKN